MLPLASARYNKFVGYTLLQRTAGPHSSGETIPVAPTSQTIMNKIFSLHTDGGARGNPGPAAIGGVVADDTGRVIKEFSRYIGETTNNQAEYKALVFGLEQIHKLVGAKATTIEVKAFLDSELIVKQMTGEYRVRDINLQPLYAQVQKLVQKFGRISFAHVRREKNNHADALVNQALDKRVG
jgi:ribonuclease HI